MWRQFKLLNTLNALTALCVTTGLAMLCAALVILWLRFLPIQRVELEKPLDRVSFAELSEVLRGRLRGNFFTISLSQVRFGLESLPWVRRATVRRVWPDRLIILLEEQVPVAHWGNSGKEWVNAEGEVFAATLPGDKKSLPPGMPRLHGPEGTATELLRRYEESRRLLAPLSLEPAALTFSARLSLDMRLANGMTLKLGREEQGGISATRRLKRFVAAYPRFVAKRQPPPKIVDLRYPNGFVLSPGRP